MRKTQTVRTNMLPDIKEHTMDGRGKKILIAGDYVSNRNPLVRLLKQAQ